MKNLTSTQFGLVLFIGLFSFSQTHAQSIIGEWEGEVKKIKVTINGKRRDLDSDIPKNVDFIISFKNDSKYSIKAKEQNKQAFLSIYLNKLKINQPYYNLKAKEQGIYELELFNTNNTNIKDIEELNVYWIQTIFFGKNKLKIILFTDSKKEYEISLTRYMKS